MSASIKAFIYHEIEEHLKISAPGLKEPAREAIARALSIKLSAKLSGQNIALHAEIDRLQTENADLRKAQWQDISTAPKDRTDILLGCFGEFGGNTYIVACIVACWDENPDYPMHPWISEGERHHRDSPTHWMPLLKPPEGK